MVVSILINHIIILFVLWLNAQVDKYQMKRGETIDHSMELIVFSALIITFLSFNILVSWWLYAAYIFHYFALRLLFFDRIINKIMGWQQDYLGETAQTDKYMKVLRKYGFESIVRVGAVMLSAFFVIGESISAFLNESQENLFAWGVLGSMLIAILYYANKK